MTEPVRVVCYLNQFFGQIGGEEKANTPPQKREEPVGPATGLDAALNDSGTVVGTVICGDDYFNENTEEAQAEILEMIKSFSPDVVVAGPAFNAGRYGMACGAVAEIVVKSLQIPVVSGMYTENPGVDMYRQYAYIVETGNSAAGMRKALPQMAELVIKLGRGEELGLPEEEGYLPRGVRINKFVGERGSTRAVNMLLKKLAGDEFKTEYPMPDFDRVEPNPPLEDLEKATVALVTSGGIVPKGNPDHIESSSASKYGRYYIGDFPYLTRDDHETAHGGYDPVAANEDPDRVLPVDVLREMEKEGKIGKLYDYFYSTVGNGTSVANSKRFAEEIAAELKNDGVQAVILTST